MAFKFQPVAGRLHHAFRFHVARTGVGALVAGHALPDDVLVAQQFLFHARADQVDPVARVELRVNRVDRTGVGAGAALPATVDEFTSGQGCNFLFEFFVVVGDYAALDKGAPVPGYIYTLDFEVFLNVQVLGAYQ